MSLLPIIGGGGTQSSPQQPEHAQNDKAKADKTDSEATQTQTAAESGDTAPPAPATQTADSGTDTATKPTDPEAESAKVTLLADSSAGSSTQSAVEAAFDPEADEAAARRIAEAAQQQQRLEQLIEAVGTPTEATNLSAPAAEQEQVGNAETDGVPV